jgi:hypothetical protein
MKTIEYENTLYAIIQRKEDWEEGLQFLTPNELFCQVGTWWYQEGQKLKAHRHISNERKASLTQECVIIMSGSVRIDLYNNDDEVFSTEILSEGDFMIMVAGGHGYEILESDTKIIECKNGPFISVEKDKELIKPLLAVR